MYNKHLDLYLLNIEKMHYYDAHEVLESIWFPRRFEKSNEVKLLKGFINAAVSFELYKRGRIVQSKRVWATYLKYRQFLYKIDSLYIKKYHYIARYIEREQQNLIKGCNYV